MPVESNKSITYIISWHIKFRHMFPLTYEFLKDALKLSYLVNLYVYHEFMIFHNEYKQFICLKVY